MMITSRSLLWGKRLEPSMSGVTRSSPPWISFCRVFEIAGVEEEAIAQVAMRVRQAGNKEMYLFLRTRSI